MVTLAGNQMNSFFHGKLYSQRECSTPIFFRQVGDPRDNECRIELENFRPEDAGHWECKMEPYVWGSGTGIRKSKYINVEVIPGTVVSYYLLQNLLVDVHSLPGRLNESP